MNTFLKKIVSVLEFSISKENKTYTEEEYKQFADKAMTYSVLIPVNTFSYAKKAKKSSNPAIVKRAEKAETVAFFLCLPIILAITFGIGSWLFSGTIFAIVPIMIIAFIVFKVVKNGKSQIGRKN